MIYPLIVVRAILGLVLGISVGSAAVDQANPDAGHRTICYTNAEALLRLRGDTAVHDWQANGKEVNCFLEVAPDFLAGPASDLSRGEMKARCEVSIPVDSLRSIKSDGTPYDAKFDEVMWERLDIQRHPIIHFRLEKLVFKQMQEGAYLFDSTGDLVVRGITNAVKMQVSIAPLPGAKMRVTGSAVIKQSDFKIPTGIVCFAIPRDDAQVALELTLRRRE